MMKKRPAKVKERWLRNRLSKREALAKLRAEDIERTTVSFYRYVKLDTQEEVHALRDRLFLVWEDLGCLGRIYLAQEGINAQMSVPQHTWDEFLATLNNIPEFKDMPLKIGIQEGESFWKLNIKVKKQIVADGLSHTDYDIENVGNHLDAESFNKAMEDPDTVVVDMRNGYESDIGHFQGAVTPKVNTFREELPYVSEQLQDEKDKKILLYCTGGIRCEKASAYLKSRGFSDVNQLHGGIISYKHQVQEQQLENKFRGANFVFDGRTRERISDEILGKCEQCEEPCDLHTNCAYQPCNKLMLQCENCNKELQETCSPSCHEAYIKTLTTS